jgi:hypothetical protein
MGRLLSHAARGMSHVRLVQTYRHFPQRPAAGAIATNATRIAAVVHNGVNAEHALAFLEARAGSSLNRARRTLTSWQGLTPIAAKP